MVTEEVGVPIFAGDSRARLLVGQDAVKKAPCPFRYLPKKTDLQNLDNTYLQTIVQALNNRPRKILNHRTPAERFLKLTRVALHP
jgi:hypothetical protein